MKKCVYCGREYPDDSSFCAADGYALRSSQDPAVPPPVFANDHQKVLDAEHIRLLSIFHFVIAGLCLVAILFLFVHFAIMSTIFTHPGIFTNNNGPPPSLQFFLPFMIFIYLGLGGFITIIGCMNVCSGIFLRKRKHRMFSMVAAGINCLQIPFGTMLGIFTLLVLSRESVRKMYGD